MELSFLGPPAKSSPFAPPSSNRRLPWMPHLPLSPICPPDTAFSHHTAKEPRFPFHHCRELGPRHQTTSSAPPPRHHPNRRSIHVPLGLGYLTSPTLTPYLIVNTAVRHRHNRPRLLLPPLALLRPPNANQDHPQVALAYLVLPHHFHFPPPVFGVSIDIRNTV